MVQFTIENKKLSEFITGFGKDLNDIVFRVQDDSVESAVGKDTYYLRKRVTVSDTDKGEIPVSNLTKLLAFLKACKTGDVTLTFRGGAGSIHVACNNSTLQLPTSTYLQSQQQLPLIERMVNLSEESMWQKWADFPLDCHGTVIGDDLQPATQFDKVIGGKFSCRVEFDANEIVIRAGSKVKGKMFVRAAVVDGKIKGEATQSSYAYWLPALLSTTPSGSLSIHTGDETVLVIEQPETGYLLVIMDQDFEED
tara:strand:+ start:834 stop:1589 length:756 start_codon:yes stop_codon:yes gene_type:complete